MFILRALVGLFLMPGNLALRAVGITLEEDGGIFRSMVNMLFWGTVLIPFVLVWSMRWGGV